MRYVVAVFMILVFINVSFDVNAKSLSRKKKVDFSVEYIHSPNTYNRSVRAIGYFHSNFLWGIYGENTSDHANALEEDADSKGCLYNVFGYRLFDHITAGPMVGLGSSIYNQSKLQYGGFLGLRVSMFMLSCQYTSTSNFGVGLGFYFR